MSHLDEHGFIAPIEVHTFSALLFDMDGTIIDSTNAIIKFWHHIGKDIGVDPEIILATSHGRRSIDVLEIIEPKLANWGYVCAAEGAIPKKWGHDAVEIPGSRTILESLEHASAPWAIVTSGTRPLITGWLEVMGLAHPEHLISAEQVARGKPDPACYKLGAQRLGVQSDDVLVLEDAPAGVSSGKAAGYKVVALATTHTVQQLQEAGADWIVRDMRSVTMESFDNTSGKVKISIKDALVQ